MIRLESFPTFVRKAQIWIMILLCAGCSIQVQKKALHRPADLAEEEGLDGRSPWLKAHLPNGDLYLLTDWSVDEAGRQITGSGTRMNARRETLSSGPFAVPVDSVALFESNVVQTSPLVAGLTVLTIATFAATLYCISNPKACYGSCPTFYAEDESGEPVLLAEGFSASVAPALEAVDVDALYRAAEPGRRFTLTMTNEAMETHVVRHADLLLAPRPPGGRVFAAQDGTWWQATSLRPARRCQGSEGDCTDLLAACDGRERFSLADSLDLATREVLELEFDEIPAGDLGLVIASRHSLLSTFLFYQGLAYLGEQAAPALVRYGESLASPDGGGAMAGLLGKIEVQVPEADGTWRTVGSTGETGPLAVNVHLLRLPALDPTRPSLRLRMTRGNWRLDHVALAVLGEPVEPVRVRPSVIRREGAPDPDLLACLNDSGRSVVTLPGDRLEIVYDLPPADHVWELFLASQGYYLEWMREEWLVEEDPLKAAMLFGRPELALRDLAPKFKRIEPEMEALFWGSRYAR